MAFEITDANFQTEVLDNNKVTMIDLWAEWCGPCKMMGPVVDALAKDFEGVATIGKLNVDDNSVVPERFNVRGIPTFLIFKNGELADKIVGATTKDALAKAITAQL